MLAISALRALFPLAIGIDFYFVAVREKGDEPPLISSEHCDVMLGEAIEYGGMRVVKLVLITVGDESEPGRDLIEKLL